MSTITFDTLKFVERLEQAGVPCDQASAMAEASKDASGEAEIATRKDIALLAVAEIKTEIANVRGEMAFSVQVNSLQHFLLRVVSGQGDAGEFALAHLQYDARSGA